MTNSGNNWINKDGRKESSLQIPKNFCHWGGGSISVFIVEFAYDRVQPKMPPSISFSVMYQKLFI